MDQIAALAVPSPIKDEWHKELNSICLTDDTPDALEKLISQVSQYKQTLVFEALCHNPFAEELKPPPTGTLESLTFKLGRTFDLAGRTDRGANAEEGTRRASDAVNQVIQSLIEMGYTQQLYKNYR